MYLSDQLLLHTGLCSASVLQSRVETKRALATRSSSRLSPRLKIKMMEIQSKELNGFLSSVPVDICAKPTSTARVNKIKEKVVDYLNELKVEPTGLWSCLLIIICCTQKSYSMNLPSLRFVLVR